MTVPVFVEYEPAIDCGCAGCAEQRRTAARALPTRYGGHPAAHGARRALVLVTAAGVVLGSGTEAVSAAPVTGPARTDGSAGRLTAAAEPASPQGTVGPLGGASAAGSVISQAFRTNALPVTTRAQIISRAKKWVSQQVPYSMEKYWSDGYRQDCSGYVSMAWNLGSNEWTGSLAAYGTRISRDALEPGDILLFHNPADPGKGSHVTIFGGWTDSSHTSYTAYEQTRPHTRAQKTPMAYWSHSDSYLAYRYRGLSTGSGGAGSATSFPGAAKFGPGADNTYVAELGKLLVARGGKRFYQRGPGPRWTDVDRRATQAFQQAQGWKGKQADGLPGPGTWRLLTSGAGRDIPATGGGGAGGGAGGAKGGGSQKAPAFPGRGFFKRGASNSHVARLGKRLVQKGYGTHYRVGPGTRWSEADRRNVEAFQRAQGWRGASADGYPGPETWRRLFA
ncbi:peptidoglycan-binding protein [Streptomyces sp. AM 4-1-1]|uniref:peptidoglycan-binding protein n=1 Tax=unclassified Streptomyces TaxID=2593676 RepID=UPI0023B8B59F|nr:peptidoglycan-binding protein [Streptomyces sp. AM 4-1-1]WEH33562.1 peptidoglycan-binding protein [Streptomyces sp. AM 4-1-1]